MTKLKTTIHDLCSHAPGDINLAAEICKLIAAAPREHQPELMVQFLLEYKYTKTDKNWHMPEIFDPDDQEDLLELVEERMSALLELLRREKLTESQFHSRLWTAIEAIPLEKERYAALCYCAQAEDLPYIDPNRILLLSPAEFRQEARQLDPALVGMVWHTCMMGYGDMLQDASVLLPLLDQVPDLRQKTVLFALMLSRLRNKMMFPILKRLVNEE